MCGRYYIEQEEDIAEMRQILEEVNRRFQDSPVLSALKTGEIAPSHVAPVLRLHQDGSERVVADLLQWGYPKYQGSGLVINARSETAAEKPMFRSAVQQGRILIPANAFFEWHHEVPERKGRKIKLNLAAQPTFYMAGLARLFYVQEQQDLRIQRFVILTTAANASVAPIHNRMPLILPREALKAWLTDQKAADTLLREPVELQLDAAAVS